MRDEIVVTATGEIDAATAPQLGEDIAYALREAVARIVVDLREVAFLDSSGMNALVRAKHLADGVGVDLVVRSPNGLIRNSLTIAGIDMVVEVED